jgi:LL-diaminopimelate aminotransferase
VDAVGRLKSNVDSGMFRPVQYAAIEALNLPAAWIEERNQIYRRRRDVLVDGCNAIGMRAQSPLAGLYVWAHVPEGSTLSSKEFAQWLFERTGVMLTAGSNFGPSGEGYVRIAITEPEERIRMAMQRVQDALRS